MNSVKQSKKATKTCPRSLTTNWSTLASSTCQKIWLWRENCNWFRMQWTPSHRKLTLTICQKHFTEAKMKSKGLKTKSSHGIISKVGRCSSRMEKVKKYRDRTGCRIQTKKEKWVRAQSKCRYRLLRTTKWRCRLIKLCCRQTVTHPASLRKVRTYFSRKTPLFQTLKLAFHNRKSGKPSTVQWSAVSNHRFTSVEGSASFGIVRNTADNSKGESIVTKTHMRLRRGTGSCCRSGSFGLSELEACAFSSSRSCWLTYWLKNHTYAKRETLFVTRVSGP